MRPFLGAALCVLLVLLFAFSSANQLVKTAVAPSDSYSYSITFAVVGSGTTNPAPGTYSYNEAQVVSITAVPGSGYAFSSWSADSSVMIANSSSASTTATINGDSTITATFIQIFQVNFATNGNGTTNPSGTQTYNAGQQIPITATPASGYSFTAWSTTPSNLATFTNSTSPTTTATIDAGGTVTASFKQNTYQVSFATNGGGTNSSTSPSGTQTYTQGELVSITANAANGYTFSTWTASPTSSATFDNANSASTTATINGQGTITASFTRNTYSVSVSILPSSSAGTVTGYVTTQTYHYGDAVTLTETPNNGYTFQSWSGDGSGTSTTCQITVTKNMAVTATFIQSTYKVTVYVLPSPAAGTVTANATSPYHYGDVVVLTANPNAGYTFGSWSGAGSGTGNVRTLTVTANMTVNATFTQNTYTVSTIILPSSATGTVTANATGPYHYGDILVLTESPNNGYTFQNWGGDGSGSGASCQVTITKNMNVTATFAPSTYAVNVNIFPSQTAGSVTANSTGLYHYGDVVFLTESPSSGYSFSSWSGDGTGNGTIRTVLVSRNMTVNATFTLINFQVNLTTNGNGTTTPSGTQAYSLGQQISINASPGNGYSFSSWSVNPSGAVTFANAGAASTTAIVNGNATITATFIQTTYQVSFLVNGGGTTNPAGTQIYAAGQEVVISANANTGYGFSVWDATGSIVLDSTTSASATATINGPGTITAVFVELASTPSPSPTSTYSPSQPYPTWTPLPTLTPTPSTVPTSSPLASPTPIPNATVLQAMSSNGSNVTLGVGGNITSSDVLNANIAPVQSASLTTVSLSVTVPEGANSFGNLSIPKYAIVYGSVPTIYVNNQIPPTQGFTQDNVNYYVWYTTPLNAYELSIVFATVPSVGIVPVWAFVPVVVVSLIVILFVLIVAVSMFKRQKERGLVVRLFNPSPR